MAGKKKRPVKKSFCHSSSYIPTLIVTEWDRKLNGLEVNPKRPLSLNLVPFGNPQAYYHLKTKPVYLAVRQDSSTTTVEPPQKLDVDEGEGEKLTSSSDTSSYKEVDGVEERSIPLLLKALEKVKSQLVSLGPEKEARAKLVFRFGKVMFYTRSKNGLNLTQINPVFADELESHLGGGRTFPEPISKTFETDMEPYFFNKLEKIAEAQATSHFQHDQKFDIRILDSECNDNVIRVTCIPVGSKLQIQKVICDAVRELMVDILPVARESSFRISFSTDTRVHELEGEVKEAVEAIVDRAVVDPLVNGGLRWPNKDSSQWSSPCSNRKFWIRGVRFFHNVKKLENEDWKWSFKKVRGYEQDQSFERSSNEIEMRSRQWKRILLQYRASGESADSTKGNEMEEMENEIAAEMTKAVKWFKENLP